MMCVLSIYIYVYLSFNLALDLDILIYLYLDTTLPGGSVVKNPPAKQETWVGLWGREDFPGFLPGKSHGQRSHPDLSIRK